MFEKSITWQPIGTLHSKGTCRWWKGTWSIPDFGKFDVLIHTNKGEPLDEQQTACLNLQQHIPALRNAASDILLSVLQEHPDIPDDITLTADNLWDFLTPQSIEITDKSYYSNDDIAIHLNFSCPWDEEELLCFTVCNGIEVDALY